jgi:hypothetical protein
MVKYTKTNDSFLMEMPTSNDYLSNRACLSSGVRVELTRDMEHMQHTTEEEEKRKKSKKKIKIAMNAIVSLIKVTRSIRFRRRKDSVKTQTEDKMSEPRPSTTIFESWPRKWCKVHLETTSRFPNNSLKMIVT